jgi:hypothetical protein
LRRVAAIDNQDRFRNPPAWVGQQKSDRVRHVPGGAETEGMGLLQDIKLLGEKYSRIAPSISVCTQPGATQLTRIPSGASSIASDFAKPIGAALLAP